MAPVESMRTWLGALAIGNNRLAWGPEGDPWIGQTRHGWPGRPGIQRVRFTGTDPFAVRTMRLTPDGFRLHLTRPVDPASLRADSALTFRRYRYRYDPRYGSPRLDEREVAVVARRISENGRSVAVELADLREDYVYQLDLRGVRSAAGRILSHDRIFYTLRRLRR